MEAARSATQAALTAAARMVAPRRPRFATPRNSGIDGARSKGVEGLGRAHA